MQHIEEGTIHAWLDGQLSAEKAAEVEAHVDGCPECAALVAEARGFIAGSSRIVSALDSIPGNVLPFPAPLRLPWYSSARLRAAAGIVVFIGASLLVIRGGDESSINRVMKVSAPSRPETAPSVLQSEQPVSAEMNRATADRSTAAQASGIETPEVAKASPPPDKLKANNQVRVMSPATSATSTRALSKTADEARAEHKTALPAAPVATPIAVPAPTSFGAQTAQQLDSTRRTALEGRVGGAIAMRDVVVTGVATTATAELHQVRTDTIGSATRTVYSVSPGVEVTLMEPSSRRSARVANKEAMQATPPSANAAAAPSRVTADSVASMVNSITWTQKATGRTVTLSGPLSKEALEALRERLPSDKR